MKVVLVATIKPEWARLAYIARTLHGLGVQVYLATAFDPKGGLRPAGILETRQLRMDLTGRRGGQRPRRFSPRWVRTVLRNFVVHAYRRFAGRTQQVWLLARYDPWFRRHARTADAIVAMEPPAVYPVWKAARRWSIPCALLGPDLLIDQFGDAKLLAEVERKVALGSFTPDDVLSAWIDFVMVSGHPLRERMLQRSPRVARALRQARAFDAAEEIIRSALTLPVGADVAAELQLELTTVQLSKGVETDLALNDVVGEVLRIADERLAQSDVGGATDLIQRVTEAVFHRELHADVEFSPLADNPAEFLRLLHSSTTYRALNAPPGGAGPAGSVAPERANSQTGPTNDVMPSAVRPRRLLVISGGNLHFTRRLIEDVQSHLGLEVRWLDLSTAGGDYPRRSRWTVIHDRLAEATGGTRPALTDVAHDMLAWPDVVFVDWCDIAAQWAAIHVPRTVRLIVRIHSLEVVSPEPHMLDWSRVSDVIFVSKHVRDLAVASVPRMAEAGRIHVLPNEMRLKRFTAEKNEVADRTICMIGWGQRVKDPIWGLEVLSILRRKDPGWKLQFIGSDFADSQRTSGYLYRDAFRRRASEDDVVEGIRYLGYVEDLPTALQDAGFVLSASRREGFPVGPTEAVASGAVPVIRDWPMYASYGAAAAVYPADWVVSTPEEAADRILAHADPQVRNAAGIAARGHVIGHFDWSTVVPLYEQIFAGSDIRTVQ